MSRVSSLQHGRQMRMIYDVPVNKRDHGVHKSNQAPGRIKRPDCRRITGPGDHVQPDRHYPNVVILPHRSLELDTLLKSSTDKHSRIVTLESDIAEQYS